jgi:hypothetical protein
LNLKIPAAFHQPFLRGIAWSVSNEDWRTVHRLTKPPPLCDQLLNFVSARPRVAFPEFREGRPRRIMPRLFCRIRCSIIRETKAKGFAFGDMLRQVSFPR